jgi:hypothetical protein
MGSEKATIIKRTNPRLWDFLVPALLDGPIDGDAFTQVSARHPTPHCDRLVSLVDSICSVLSLIVTMRWNGDTVERHRS